MLDTLCGVRTSGAFVMTGKEKGAVNLLTEKQQPQTAPQSFQAAGVHCAAHQVNLAACKAVRVLPYVSKFKELLQQLRNFYASSSLQTAG